jgi:hypothetical protein
MSDPLEKRLTKLKLFSGSVKRRSSLYSDLVKVDDKKTAKSLGALNRASAPGKKIQKAGFILFWIPEPTGISNAIGGPMILAGRYLDKVYNGSTLKDIGVHTKDTVSSIGDFKKSIL